MLIDSRLEFSDGQTLTADGPSDNVIDLSVDRDIGPGRPMWVVVNVIGALTGTGDVTATLQTSADNSTYTDVASVVVPKGEGSVAVVGVPYQNARYLRLNYAGATAGKVQASLTDQEPRSWQAYPDAV